MMVPCVLLVNATPGIWPIIARSHNGTRRYNDGHPMRLSVAVLALVGTNLNPVLAGEISGLPPHSPPTVRPDYHFFLGNDFLVPGTNDDYRTQQLIATARFRERWIAVLDQSIFTNERTVAGPAERIDTMSVSLGYDFFQKLTPTERTSVTAGFGIRAVGDFEGSRIQNGFHQLVQSDLSTLAYSSTRQSDATVWGLAERYRMIRPAAGNGLFGGWDLGYWARAGALVTADGQIDAVAGLYAMASRTNFDVWLGMRYDWRGGYDMDEVLRVAAEQEQKAAISWGVRMGSLVLETVYRLDSQSSYGQLSFVSAPETRKETQSYKDKADVQLGLQIPHMLFQVAGRLHYKLLIPESSAWRESYLVDIRAGQPQLGGDVNRFIETYQATVGIEWSRALGNEYSWLRFYTNLSAGWRSEQLLGEAALLGEKSSAVDRSVLVAGAGVEVDATRLGSHWRQALRFGVTGWKPSSSASVSIGGQPSTIQESGASIVVAWTLNYH
jgi:hypothetical protein